jgi:hypothetical protein
MIFCKAFPNGTLFLFCTAGGNVSTFNKTKIMNDLIKQIVEKTGVPADKAEQVLGVVSNFIKQKFPAIGGQIDSVLGTAGQGGTATAGNALSDVGSKLGF